MSEHEQMVPDAQHRNHSTESENLVGSQTTWLAARIGDIFVLLAAIFVLADFRMPISYRLVVFGIACAIAINSHQVVYGFIVEDGVLFRRYWKWIKIPWKEIESMSRRPLLIVLDHKGSNFFNRRILFYSNPTLFGMRTKHVGFSDLKEAWLIAQTTETLSRNLHLAAE